MRPKPSAKLRRSSSSSHRQPTRSSAAARADDWFIGSKATSSPRANARRSTRPIPAAISCRHGRPDEHIHAIQIEIDRRLYLDSNLTAPGKGLAGTAALLRRMIDAAAGELLAGGLALAAE